MKLHIGWIALFVGALCGSAANLFANDSYIAGYTTAELHFQYHLANTRVKVNNGVVTIFALPAKAEQKRIVAQLEHVTGVRKVVFAVPAPQATTTLPAAPTPAARRRRGAVTAFGGRGTGGAGAAGRGTGGPAATTPVVAEPVSAGAVPARPLPSGPLPASPKYWHRVRAPYAFGLDLNRHRRHLYRMPTGFLPPGQLFTPLLADPKWPGFSAAYANYAPYHPGGLNAVVQVALGGTVPLYRGNLGHHWQWETGLFATDYAYFNTNAQNVDLQNNDYQVGGYTAVRHKNLSFLVRFFHQSSHLGDGYIVNNLGTTEDVSVFSYEQLSGFVSLDFFHRWFRVYTGGGYFFDTNPYDLGKIIFQYGAEFHGPAMARFHDLYVSPVAGIDFKNWAETHYSTDISARAGIQLDNGSISSPRLQFLLEFYHGHSPFGQFYTHVIQYVGIGMHLQY